MYKINQYTLKTIFHIVGNRPQFIKLAILYKELFHAGFSQKIVHSGQHSSAEMSDIFFSQLALPEIDFLLQLQNAYSPETFIAEASISLEEYLSSYRDSYVFVYGDTNTTLAGATAAHQLHIPLFHFEAGVRTGDKNMPEEINRILTDRIANTNYCCTEKNYSKLVAEGYGTTIKNRVKLTGDLMYDAFLKIPFETHKKIAEKNYVAATIHRAANIGLKDNLSAIIDGLNSIHKEIPVVMPLHPHTRKRIDEYGLNPEFSIIDPLGYPAMKTFLINCSFVITDSGGAAREAFFCKKESIIVMEYPFWPEIIEAGCSMNVPAHALQLYESFFKLPTLCPDFETPIFGNGNAAELIREDILLFKD